MSAIDKDKILKNVKEDLAIEGSIQDTVLKRLIVKVINHFTFKYDVTKVDSKFGFIIEDCTIRRFNRRKAEGAKRHSQGDYSVEYDEKSEFDEWHDDILAILHPIKDEDDSYRAGRLYYL
ncbi:phage head-tail connector protein [Aerococcaceae bacterium WGS1372]